MTEYAVAYGLASVGAMHAVAMYAVAMYAVAMYAVACLVYGEESGKTVKGNY